MTLTPQFSSDSPNLTETRLALEQSSEWEPLKNSIDAAWHDSIATAQYVAPLVHLMCRQLQLPRMTIELVRLVISRIQIEREHVQIGVGITRFVYNGFSAQTASDAIANAHLLGLIIIENKDVRVAPTCKPAQPVASTSTPPPTDAAAPEKVATLLRNGNLRNLIEDLEKGKVISVLDVKRKYHRHLTKLRNDADALKIDDAAKSKILSLLNKIQ